MAAGGLPSVTDRAPWLPTSPILLLVLDPLELTSKLKTMGRIIKAASPGCWEQFVAVKRDTNKRNDYSLKAPISDHGNTARVSRELAFKIRASSRLGFKDRN